MNDQRGQRLAPGATLPPRPTQVPATPPVSKPPEVVLAEAIHHLATQIGDLIAEIRADRESK